MSMHRNDLLLLRIVVATTCISVACSTTYAFDLPIQVVSGTGIFTLPSPTTPVTPHDITTDGVVEFGGNTLNYTGNGEVRVLGPQDPTTLLAPFDSAIPFLFDFGNGDTLQMHYGHPELGAPDVGMVLLQPVGNLLDATFDAVFNPVPRTGTGQFEGVVGGAFRMIAETDPFDPLQPAVYMWSSDVGFLTFVPEPSSLSACGIACLILLGYRRREDDAELAR